MDPILWMLLGAFIWLLGDIVHAVVFKRRRLRVQEQSNNLLSFHANAKGREEAMKEFMFRQQRFIELLSLMTNIESAVFGHTQPDYPSWENIRYTRRENVTVVNGICRGVLVTYWLSTGAVAIRWDGNSQQSGLVDIDLREEVHASKSQELLSFFTFKRDTQRKQVTSNAGV